MNIMGLLLLLVLGHRVKTFVSSLNSLLIFPMPFIKARFYSKVEIV